MIENKIYASWAFSEDENEKMEINRNIYVVLMEKYRIYRNDLTNKLVDKADCDFGEYDIVIGRKAGYHHSEYTIFKNSPKLTNTELALLCDQGSLCFGYTMEGEVIYVFED